MPRSWRVELTRALVIASLGAMIGFFFGVTLIGLLAGMIFLLVDCWLKLRGIEAWLENKKQPGPTWTRGVWGDVLSHLYRSHRQSRKRKKRETAIR